ncbi:acetylserotonin O-methyltransferase-like [Impatiens glandulifera]|uniref:acetylserotonin O-methyltransferase-like n=1 Tax=Impatiens glandulifera TaxID=253017 RepID=UPI001FB0DB29|nr:acetylserotonin O-methyltransferase-like [Impatiens glandulifera]
MAVVRCAIDLGIPDILENQDGRPMSLSDLSSNIGCSPSTLHRIMRFLVNRRIFHHHEKSTIDQKSTSSNSNGYVKTALSSLLTKNGDKSMAAFVVLHTSPSMLAPWLGLSKRVLTDCKSHAFEAANGKDIWSYAEANSEHNKLLNDAMACDSRLVVPAVIDGCSELFLGLESVVDVGGGNGTTMRLLVEAFPWIRGIVFDLPHVIAHAKEEYHVGLDYIAGDMFHAIPKADSVFIKWVLHDWGDEECIKILKNCKDAIPKDKGKVIIVEAVISEEDERKSESFEYVKLMLDMVMMAETETGKQRTSKEWEHVLDQAGFSHHTFHSIQAVQSVIVAYP